jgi:hypothetical protein
MGTPNSAAPMVIPSMLLAERPGNSARRSRGTTRGTDAVVR